MNFISGAWFVSKKQKVKYFWGSIAGIFLRYITSTWNDVFVYHLETSLFSKQLIQEFPIKAIHKTLYTAVPSRFSLASVLRHQSILSWNFLVTVALQFDWGEVCLRELFFLKVLSCRRAFISVLYQFKASSGLIFNQLVKRQRTSTERGRNPINKQISPCIVTTNQRAGFDRTLIRSRAFLENRK